MFKQLTYILAAFADAGRRRHLGVYDGGVEFVGCFRHRLPNFT